MVPANDDDPTVAKVHVTAAEGVWAGCRRRDRPGPRLEQARDADAVGRVAEREQDKLPRMQERHMDSDDLGLVREPVLAGRSRQAGHFFENTATTEPAEPAAAFAPPVIEPMAGTRHDFQVSLARATIVEVALNERDRIGGATPERCRTIPVLTTIVIAPPVGEPTCRQSRHDLEVALRSERALDRGQPAAGSAGEGRARPAPLEVVVAPVVHEAISLERNNLEMPLSAVVALEERRCVDRAGPESVGSAPGTS